MSSIADDAPAALALAVAPPRRGARRRRSRSRSSTPPTSTAGSTRTTRWPTRTSARGSRASRRRSGRSARRASRRCSSTPATRSRARRRRRSPSRARSAAGWTRSSRAMNLVGYDAMAVGNHEFDFGVERLEALARQARFPWLSANTLGSDGEPAFPPYAVKEIAGVRVGILGLVTPPGRQLGEPRRSQGLRFGDSVAAARRYVPILRGRERCDLVVVIAHEGFERDPATGQATRRTPARTRPTPSRPRSTGVDLVLAGPRARGRRADARLGKTWVSEPGRWGEHAHAFRRHARAGRARPGGSTRVAGRNLPMKSVEPDAAVVAEAAAEHDAAMRVLGGGGRGSRFARLGGGRARPGHGAARLAPRRPAARREGRRSPSPRCCRRGSPTGRRGR